MTSAHSFLFRGDFLEAILDIALQCVIAFLMEEGEKCKLFDAVLSSITDGVFTTDGGGKITFKKLDYPLVPLILALVLGDRAEVSFRQAILGS